MESTILRKELTTHPGPRASSNTTPPGSKGQVSALVLLRILSSGCTNGGIRERTANRRGTLRSSAASGWKSESPLRCAAGFRGHATFL